MARSTLPFVLLAIIAPLGTPAKAQETRPPDLLRGPTVPETITRPSLVDRAFTGQMSVLQGRPEVAAVDLLDIPPPLKARAAALERDHTRALALRLVDEIDLVREITDLNASRKYREARERARELQRRIDPDLDPVPLMPAIVDLAGEQHRPEIERIVAEYHEALIDRRLNAANNPERAGDPARRERIRRDLVEQAFLRDLRSAYDLSLRHYREVLDAVTAAVEPTDQQQQAIRTLVLDHIRATRLEATPDQRRATMRAIYDLLDPDRKARLFDYVVRTALPDA